MTNNKMLKFESLIKLLLCTTKKYYFLRDAFAEIQTDDILGIELTMHIRKYNTNKNYYKCINELWKQLKKDNVHSRVYTTILNNNRIPAKNKQLLLDAITDIENNKNDILGKTAVHFDSLKLVSMFSWTDAEAILGLPRDFFSEHNLRLSNYGI